MGKDTMRLFLWSVTNARQGLSELSFLRVRMYWLFSALSARLPKLFWSPILGKTQSSSHPRRLELGRISIQTLQKDHHQ